MIGTAKERRDDLEHLYPVWEALTLWERLEKNVFRFSDSPYVLFEDASYTYAQVKAESERAARALLTLRVRRGTHVAIISHNRPEYIFMIYAISRIGAVWVPINVNIQQNELEYVLEQSDSEYVFTDRRLTDLPASVRAVVSLDRAAYSDFLANGRNLSDESWREATAVRLDSKGMFGIMYTSGSTSRPKGVILTCDMLLRSAYSTCLCRCMEIGRRIYVPIPLFHAFAVVEGLLAALICGGSVVMTREHFEAAHALSMMKWFEVNDIICVSVIMHNLLTKGPAPKPEDYPHMHAAYWASTCADWIWQAARDAFGIDDVTTSYGMTECGSTTVMLTPEDPHDYPLWCHGRQKIAGTASLPDADGHQFYIKIIDSILGSSEFVKEVETVGVFHPKYGEVSVAFVELREDTPENRERVRQYGCSHLAKFQNPRYYCFSPQILWPHTSSDKISKSRLRRETEEWMKTHEIDENAHEIDLYG